MSQLHRSALVLRNLRAPTDKLNQLFDREFVRDSQRVYTHLPAHAQPTQLRTFSLAREDLSHTHTCAIFIQHTHTHADTQAHN